MASACTLLIFSWGAPLCRVALQLRDLQCRYRPSAVQLRACRVCIGVFFSSFLFMSCSTHALIPVLSLISPRPPGERSCVACRCWEPCLPLRSRLLWGGSWWRLSQCRSNFSSLSTSSMSFLHLRMLLSAGTAYSSTATHIQSKFVVLAIVFGIGILRVRSAEIYFWIWISHRGRCNEKQGVVWLLGWTSLRSLWLPNVNPLLAQVGCRAVVCRSAGIGAKFLSGVYQATLQGTALPAGVGAGQTAFIPKSREVNASAGHRWIFAVLERAGVPQTLQRFLRGIYADSATSVEHSCVACGQFAMMRSVRHGCPASGYLFTVAFDPVFRWLMT